MRGNTQVHVDTSSESLKWSPSVDKVPLRSQTPFQHLPPPCVQTTGISRHLRKLLTEQDTKWSRQQRRTQRKHKQNRIVLATIRVWVTLSGGASRRRRTRVLGTEWSYRSGRTERVKKKNRCHLSHQEHSLSVPWTKTESQLLRVLMSDVPYTSLQPLEERTSETSLRNRGRLPLLCRSWGGTCSH